MDMRWCRSRYPGGVADEAEDSGIIGVLFDNCLGFESIVFQNPGGFFAECSLKSDLKRRIGWQQSWRSHRRSKSGNSAPTRFGRNLQPQEGKTQWTTTPESAR